MAYEILKDLDLTNEELEYALRKAKGIILGFAMEYRAAQFLRNMGYERVTTVDMPSHDIEAKLKGETFYIEVKASRYSPTKEYSGHKIGMIVELGDRHLTLTMTPEPRIMKTLEILSPPKRLLYDFLTSVKQNDLEKMRSILTEENIKVLKTYSRVILEFVQKYGSFDKAIIKEFTEIL